MEKTINKNRLEIRLDPESQELLNSLMNRTNLSKTSLIKTALKVYASCLKKGHIFTIALKSASKIEVKQDIEEPTKESNPNWQEDWDKTMKDIEEFKPEDDTDL